MHHRELHLLLNGLAQTRLRPSSPGEEGPDGRALLLEQRFLHAARAEVASRAAAAPRDPDGFVAWFEALRDEGPGQGDPLFPWLAERASPAQLRWFVAQEVAGEAGFDDLVALTQVRMPVRAKLELARNYWDEMGRGRAAAMHGPLLSDLARALGVEARPESTVWEALALGNLLAGLALDRRWAFHSLGALGAVELTAPKRVGFVDRALARIGVPKGVRRYFALHATVDLRHSEAWNREVLRPLVAEEPGLSRALAEGALMRLEAGARCFARYRRELWLSGDEPAEPRETVGLA